MAREYPDYWPEITAQGLELLKQARRLESGGNRLVMTDNNMFLRLAIGMRAQGLLECTRKGEEQDGTPYFVYRLTHTANLFLSLDDYFFKVSKILSAHEKEQALKLSVEVSVSPIDKEFQQ